MCGRFSLTATPEQVAALLGLIRLDPFPPRYNIAPTQPVLMVVNGPDHARAGVLVRWGLVPAWVKDPADFTLLINARSETAATKPSFRNAFRHRRTLVPASGFYEWRRPADPKAPRQAYWVRPRDGGIVTFAGLMETWSSADGGEIDTGCILTTAANERFSQIHHRLPLVIRQQDHEQWLDCLNNEPRHLSNLMRPVDDDYFEAVPIGDAVNKVANTGAEVQRPLREKPSVEPSGETSGKRGDRDQLDLF